MVRSKKDSAAAEGVNKEVVSSSNVKSGIAKVVAWCTRHGIKVDFRPVTCLESYYDHDKKELVVSSKVHLETRLFFMLHECGHYLIGGQHTRYAGAAPGQALGARLAVVDEELEAWHRGRRLASRLGIQINASKYARTRSRAMATYLKWAIKVDGWATAQ